MPFEGHLTGRRRKRGLLLLLAAFGFSLVLTAETESSGETSTKDKGTVAEVNGKAITVRELEEPLAEKIKELEQQISELKTKKLDERISQEQIHELEKGIVELKTKKLDELIGQQLLNEEAAKKGITVEELLAKEVYETVPAVTDEDVDKFYSQYKHRMVQKPEAELKQKARELLKKYRLVNAKQNYVQSLRARANVSTFLAPPVLRIEVAVEKAPFKGPETAPVTIVKFEDFDCPFCQRVQPTLAQLLGRYGDQVKLVHRDFPIDRLHPGARQAHEAARCANDRGKFWAYHDKLYANARMGGPDELKAYAREVGLDLAVFEECLTKGTHRAAVQQDVDEGNRLGIKGTPTFLINGRVLVGAQALEQFTEVIEGELARVKASGVKPDSSHQLSSGSSYP